MLGNKNGLFLCFRTIPNYCNCQLQLRYVSIQCDPDGLLVV